MHSFSNDPIKPALVDLNFVVNQLNHYSGICASCGSILVFQHCPRDRSYPVDSIIIQCKCDVWKRLPVDTLSLDWNLPVLEIAHAIDCVVAGVGYGKMVDISDLLHLHSPNKDLYVDCCARFFQSGVFAFRNYQLPQIEEITNKEGPEAVDTTHFGRDNAFLHLTVGVIKAMGRSLVSEFDIMMSGNDVFPQSMDVVFTLKILISLWLRGHKIPFMVGDQGLHTKWDSAFRKINSKGLMPSVDEVLAAVSKYYPSDESVSDYVKLANLISHWPKQRFLSLVRFFLPSILCLGLRDDAWHLMKSLLGKGATGGLYITFVNKAFPGRTTETNSDRMSMKTPKALASLRSLTRFTLKYCKTHFEVEERTQAYQKHCDADNPDHSGCIDFIHPNENEPVCKFRGSDVKLNQKQLDVLDSFFTKFYIPMISRNLGGIDTAFNESLFNAIHYRGGKHLNAYMAQIVDIIAEILKRNENWRRVVLELRELKTRKNASAKYRSQKFYAIYEDPTNFYNKWCLVQTIPELERLFGPISFDKLRLARPGEENE